MLDTYDTHIPNNPANQKELEKEIVITPENLFDAVNECNDYKIDFYFNIIEKRLQLLAAFASNSDNTWLRDEILEIKKLLK